MTTSGVYTLSKTATEIVAGILRWIGVLGEGEAPTAQQTQDVIEAINFWLLQYSGPESAMRPGQIMWQRETAYLDLDYGVADYDLKPYGGDLSIQIPVEILSVALRDTDNVDTIMEPMTRAEYEALSDKTSMGSPTRYCYEKRIDTGKLYIDIPPDTTAAGYRLRIVYRQPCELITAGSQTLDIDGYWYRAIKFNVALDVAPEFGAVIGDAYYDIAKESMALLSTFYPEDTSQIFFQPELD